MSYSCRHDFLISRNHPAPLNENLQLKASMASFVNQGVGHNEIGLKS
jgi:hypothetical protein